uniref:Uncharacterized protein n=1 Tax=Arundo donax TaxID=35708 RepID=A0A0A9C2D9_ARUDO
MNDEKLCSCSKRDVIIRSSVVTYTNDWYNGCLKYWKQSEYKR